MGQLSLLDDDYDSKGRLIAALRVQLRPAFDCVDDISLMPANLKNTYLRRSI